MSKKPLDCVLFGCGSRGRLFADWIVANKEHARLVAVADPDPVRRDQLGDLAGLDASGRYDSFETLLQKPRMADIVVNTTMDRLHVTSAVPALRQGYHMLLEKPMAVTLADCRAIHQAAGDHGCYVAVCHSLRHHRVYQKAKALLQEGVLGQLVSIDQLEGVGPEHQAHSFVRGNWGNESRSTFMLLAKSCHDIDLIAWLMDRPVQQVSSFGSLTHFRRENCPEGAPPRCIDGCPVGEKCPYNAVTLYAQPDSSGKGKGYGGWIGLDRLSVEKRLDFIRTSDYGRCVYQMDNDVVDHQVVNLSFADAATGTFTMTAFAPGGRRTRLHGTHGYMAIDLHASTIEIHHFWHESAQELAEADYGREDIVQRRVERIDVPTPSEGHGGGDPALMENLIQAIRAQDPSIILTDTAASLASHSVVFAAEQARHSGQVVNLGTLA